ncbi:MAG: hypothetical protein V3V08_16945 [Nannocystaceae bacterium]
MFRPPVALASVIAVALAFVLPLPSASALPSPRESSPAAEAPRGRQPTHTGETRWEAFATEAAQVCAMLEVDAQTHQSALWVQQRPTSADNDWRRRAEKCPRAPEVLRAAAHGELMRLLRIDRASVGEKDVNRLASQIQRSRKRVLRWYATLEHELELRGAVLTPADHYVLAWARLGLAQRKRARIALDIAQRRGGVPPAVGYRMAALIALFDGEVDVALAASRLAWVGSGSSDALAALYVRGLVLDRAGDPAGARRVFALARKGDRGTRNALLRLETMLPIHERLYLRALERHFDRTTNAAMRYWHAYLARKEPTPAERVLAQRHLSALERVPEPVPRPSGNTSADDPAGAPAAGASSSSPGPDHPSAVRPSQGSPQGSPNDAFP